MSQYLFFEHDGGEQQAYLRFCFFATPEDVAEFGFSHAQSLTMLHLAQFKNVDELGTRSYAFCQDESGQTFTFYDYDEPESCSFRREYFASTEIEFWNSIRDISEHAGVLAIYEQVRSSYTLAMSLHEKLIDNNQTKQKRIKI